LTAITHLSAMRAPSWLKSAKKPAAPWSELAANCGPKDDVFAGLTFTFHNEMSSTPVEELQFFFSPSYAAGAAKIAGWTTEKGSKVGASRYIGLCCERSYLKASLS
jgi:hypothetical protein